jgi:thiol-disulfide isomerase/thioredoxin
MKALISFSVILLLTSCFNKSAIFKTGQEGSLMPLINVILTNNNTQTYINDLAAANKPIVLLYFSPYCPYCRALIQKIIGNNKLQKAIQLFMISDFSQKELKRFYVHYQFEDYPNILMGSDTDSFFKKYLKPPGVPCLAIYDSNRKLKKVLVGNISSDLIKDIAIN